MRNRDFSQCICTKEFMVILSAVICQSGVARNDCLHLLFTLTDKTSCDGTTNNFFIFYPSQLLDYFSLGSLTEMKPFS